MKLKNIFWLVLVLSGGSSCVLAVDETTTNTPPGALTMSYTNAYETVTKKTIMDETTNSHASASFFTTNFVSFISSVTNVGQTNLSRDDKTLVDYSLTNAAIMGDLASAGIEAGKFFGDLIKQGRLPGVSKDSHGNATADIPSTSDSFISKKIKYPFLLTYHLVSTGDSLTNHYTFIQPSKDSAWQLQRAWRTDSQGRVIKEWPVN